MTCNLIQHVYTLVSLGWAPCWVPGIPKEIQGKVCALEQEPCGGEMCKGLRDNMLSVTGEVCTKCLGAQRRRTGKLL